MIKEWTLKYVRFTPESGDNWYLRKRSAYDCGHHPKQMVWMAPAPSI
jgi:hypothetical protein